MEAAWRCTARGHQDAELPARELDEGVDTAERRKLPLSRRVASLRVNGHPSPPFSIETVRWSREDRPKLRLSVRTAVASASLQAERQSTPTGSTMRTTAPTSAALIVLVQALGVSCSDHRVDYDNFTPNVRILAPQPGDTVVEGEPQVAQGLVEDANENDTLQVWWSDGVTERFCEEQDVEPDTELRCPWTPVEGVSLLCLTADDGRAEQSQSTSCVEVVVLPTEAPQASIVSPVEGGVYQVDVPVVFEGEVSDGEDQPEDLLVGWSSNLDGAIEDADSTPDASGRVFGYASLSAGSHLIVLHVEDSDGMTSDAYVSIEVSGANSAPSCEITAPSSGESFTEGACVDLEGRVDDPDQDSRSLEVSWSSDIDGLLVESTPSTEGYVYATVCDLTAGSHVLILSVEDALGESCSTTTPITIGSAPSCTIHAPTSGEVYTEGDEVVFEAAVEDHGSDLSSLGISWSSSRDGVFDTGAAGSDGWLQVRHDGLSVGTHTVTLSATDADDGTGRCSMGTLEIEACSSVWYADADGDGYGDDYVTTTACSQPSGYVAVAGDCDDGDASFNPAALEACDGLDNDCDGTADDGVSYGYYYRDADGDGYGDAYTSSYACSQPSGYVTDSSDCDDWDSSVHPGATDICNGISDDCDSSIDEDASFRTYYLDADGDGYGGSGATSYACSQPSGYETSSSDCDDGDRNVNPGEWDDCDGVDSDCDGSVDDDEPCLTTIYFQDFESSGVFSESTVGNQTFSDGASWYDGGHYSYLRRVSGYSSSYAMGVYNPSSSGSTSTLQYVIPASATSSEDLVVTFWVWVSSSTTVEIARSGATTVSTTVPGGSWTEVSGTLASSMSTSSVMIRLGRIPSSTGSHTLALDDVMVEK